jgi:response regulator RpfG family c-di-GMP phosphodiesterase
LAELLGTLSLAAEAGTGSPEDHGLRAAIIAMRIAQLAGAEPRDASDAYYLVLLRYSGCTSEGGLAAGVFGDEIEFGRETFGMDYGDPRQILPAVLKRARKNGGLLAIPGTMRKMMAMKSVGVAHCEVASLLAARLGFDERLRAALGHLNARWNGSGLGPKGDKIAMPMRIAHVAMDVEIGYRIGGVDGAVARTKQLAKKSLDPALVEAFAAKAAEVIAAIEVPSVWTAAMAAEPAPQREVEGDAIEEAIATMAAFADLKSNYTRGHSVAVAMLAEAAGREAGLPEATLRDLRWAGLLHDLGRVAISTGIWDKPATLSDLEREKIRLHTYVGERVLSRAPSLASAAEIASLAHERLDASGYHRRLSASACPPAARILAAADVYQAMLEDRPHRKARTPEDAAAELQKTPGLCPDAVRAVLAAAGHQPKKVARVAGLTDREVEVLRALSRGWTNKEIATALDISTKTAGHHVQHIFEKIGVTTRAAATMYAMQHGITA